MDTRSSGSGSDGDAPTHIRIGLGFPEDQTLDVRISPHAADEMQELLDAEGVYAGRIHEASASQQLAILAASFGGGLGGVAAALTAYFHRNRHKGIKFSRGDTSIDLTGYSDEQAKGLIRETLEELRKEQLERDEEWRRIRGPRVEDDDQEN
ncbi:hypothetical protein SAMN04487968_101498 [Nocardioides terrae]|uniref:Uncharacterized protein n=1 Tax=Nocardioides terrae TaxID=574651 RepID=A0A1I1DU13_9ACTN|nr:hypothetical protein [Nocardioides terrae]SFB78381.1 hypothetical protein SAMN04487968_101498 [Nocardioides terrae]